jgi:signal peptidase I
MATAAPAFKKSTVREYFEAIAVAVILALFVRTFVVQAFKIPTGSMENNLLIGDHLLVNKLSFAPVGTADGAVLPVGEIHRGEIVVFKAPLDPSRDLIKRVIGLPGETVELRQKKVHINGSPIDEPYVHYLTAEETPSEYREVTSGDFKEDFGPVTVPAGEYFMMGDNRDNSFDSRYWGFMRRDFVKGKALMIYWSYDADPASYQQEGVGQSLKNILSVVVNFFTKTRWNRMFHQIH